MEVSGQFDAPVLSPPEKGLPVSNEQETEQIERYGEEENFCHSRESNGDSAVVKP
jgi:hypothetical protein